METKINIGRSITIDQLLKKINVFLFENNLKPEEVVQVVEYPDMWECDGVNVVLCKKT